MTTQNLVVKLARKPQGIPTLEDFAVMVDAMPDARNLKAGQILSRTRVLSLDPYYRNVMKNSQLYADRLAPGEAIVGETVAEIIASRDARFKAGDIVLARNGWRTYAITEGANAMPVDAQFTGISKHHKASILLGVMGMPGLTAYAGTVLLAAVKAGETFVVSAATGAVGSTAGQLARLAGARVVGIAGSAEKCAYAVDVLGYAACINYKNSDVAAQLKHLIPERINVYFDNAGGATLAAAMTNLALHARIILCGMPDVYSLDAPPDAAHGGPFLGPIVGARATVHGLVVFDHFAHMGAMQATVSAAIEAKQFHYREDITEGLENAPAAFCRLMRGENFGKAIVYV